MYAALLSMHLLSKVCIVVLDTYTLPFGVRILVFNVSTLHCKLCHLHYMGRYLVYDVRGWLHQERTSFLMIAPSLELTLLTGQHTCT